MRTKTMAVLLTLGVSLGLVVSALPTTAGADTIQGDQAQAAQLSAQIDAQNALVDQLSQQYDEAQLREQALAGQVVTIQKQVSAAQARMQATKGKLTQVAVSAYMNAGQMPQVQALFQTSASQLAISQGYLRSASDNQQNALDAYTLARQQLQTQQSQLQTAQKEAAANAATIQATARAAQQATQAAQATLNSLNGRIAELVAQQRAAEEAAREAAARAEAERAAAAAAAAQQAAAQQAAQQAATQSNSSGGSSYSNGPAPAVGHGAGQAVAYARQQIGKPYVWGASGPNAYDCSGLTSAAWGSAGVYLPHYTVSQYDATARISASQLEPGDLVFWDFPGEPNPGHVGIYVGNGQVIAADHTGAPVRQESMYYDGTPVGFGRVG